MGTDAQDDEIAQFGKTVFFVTRIDDENTHARHRSDDLMRWLLTPVVAKIDPNLEAVRADKMAPGRRHQTTG